MKPFNDTYVMYKLLEFIGESTIICLCKASKKLNEICKNYIKLEDDKRFEVVVSGQWDVSKLLQKYCRNNDVIKIRNHINLHLYWNFGLRGACEGGHMDIVKLMIEKCFDMNSGLGGACTGGHIDIVKLMIEKGARNWDHGLFHACKHGHIDCVKFMIEKGATVCFYCQNSMEQHLTKSE